MTYIADQRLLRGVAASIETTILDSDGDPAASLTVTVTVTRADGTVLATDAATTESSTVPGVYTKSLTAAQLEPLDVLVATWKVSSVTRAVTYHEVVGDYYFTAGQLRNAEPSLLGETSANLIAVRRDVEDEFERICGVAFVPRYARETVDGSGTGTVRLPHRRIRDVTSVTILDGTTTTAYTATELDYLVWEESGHLHRTDGGTFEPGTRNVVVEYEHGFDRCPTDVRRAALRRARARFHMGLSAVPDRATAVTNETGTTYRLAMPGALTVGDPEVDAVLARYALRVGAA